MPHRQAPLWAAARIFRNKYAYMLCSSNVLICLYLGCLINRYSYGLAVLKTRQNCIPILTTFGACAKVEIRATL